MFVDNFQAGETLNHHKSRIFYDKTKLSKLPWIFSGDLVLSKPCRSVKWENHPHVPLAGYLRLSGCKMVQKEPFLNIQLTLHKNFQYFKSIKSPSSTFKQANPPKNQYLPDLQFNVQVSGISPTRNCT